jgi:hypothetical protein
MKQTSVQDYPDPNKDRPCPCWGDILQSCSDCSDLGGFPLEHLLDLQRDRVKHDWRAL